MSSDPNHGQPPRYYTIEEAAELLRVSPAALLERLRVKLRRVNGREVSDLGIAIGYKFGRSWRLKVL